jgi:hypothetical protein
MGELRFYTGLSLVDITATGVTRFRPEVEHERNQHRNWETVLQALSLRTQPLNIVEPVVKELDLTDEYPDVFGDMYAGKHKVWVFSWAVDREDIFVLGDDELGALKQDFEQVPMISGLDETARFMLEIFHPYGGIRNIVFSSYVNPDFI